MNDRSLPKTTARQRKFQNDFSSPFNASPSPTPVQRVLAQLVGNLYKVVKLFIATKYLILQGMALVTLSTDPLTQSVTKNSHHVYVLMTVLSVATGRCDRVGGVVRVESFYDGDRVTRIAVLSTYDTF